MNRIGGKGRNVRLGWDSEALTTVVDKFRIEYIWDFDKGSFLVQFHGLERLPSPSMVAHTTPITITLSHISWQQCFGSGVECGAGWRQDLTAIPTPSQTCGISYLPQGRQSNRDYLTNPLNNNLGRAPPNRTFSF